MSKKYACKEPYQRQVVFSSFYLEEKAMCDEFASGKKLVPYVSLK
jgi:hypothetical protein